MKEQTDEAKAKQAKLKVIILKSLIWNLGFWECNGQTRRRENKEDKNYDNERIAEW